MYDVIVVGAGVAGCRIAELIARKGFNVALIEEHADIGTPVQCAGLVSHRLKALLPDLPDSVFLNQVNRAKFFYSSNRPISKPNFELRSKKPVHVIDRAELDKSLFEKARASGAKTKRSTKFTSYRIKEDKIVISTNKGKIESGLLVGADGPNSLVAKKAMLEPPENYLAGVQATIDAATASNEFDADAVELWFGSDITPDFFGWLIPLSPTKARIGLATRQGALNYFKNFLKKRIGTTVKPDVGGRINFGLMENTAAERVMVVGDAACHVKPLSGGGVIYGLIGAAYCANACVKALRAGDFSAGFLKQEYDEKWKRQLQKPIGRGLRYRKILLGSGNRMNLLFNIAGKLRFILESFDMDLL